ncbi:MAG: ribose-phosphate pyrophosphokinase [Defluviitaleaceae bacterium]|nr:ribose-phosphate pyrophosphokinase [Defluviitaleaceae bacterium]MCL2836259.1 ribose-phosphate pyrophosphokinase [Defluviitaleaceae bacterium]
MNNFDLSADRISINGAPMIFSCNSNKDLAERIASEVGLKLGKSLTTEFKDGEIYTRIDESVRGRDCFIVQSTSPPVNNNLMELLIMIDTMRRASARHITAVVPYFAYARQDRKARPREPITAKLVANMIVAAGANRVLTMDLHNSQIQGFFDIPMDNLMGTPILQQYYRDKFEGNMEDIVVVSPDVGGIRRARAFARSLDTPLAIVDKRRPKSGDDTVVMNIIGDIEGKRVILVDDMVSTGGTLCNDVDAILEKGAAEIYTCCTHAILASNATQRIQDSPIKELVVLDTVFVPMEKRIPKLKILSASKIFSEAIYRIHTDTPLSVLYNRYMVD